MRKFDVINNGYDCAQVDAYLSILTKKYEEKLAEKTNESYASKNELENLRQKLNEYQQKEKQISKAFMMAVEKADEIEKDAKRLANLELKKLMAMYQKWEELLKDAEEKTAIDGDTKYITKAIQSFKSSIQDFSIESLNQEKGIKDHLKKSSNDYVRNILNKMDYLFNDSNNKEKETSIISVKEYMKQEKQKENHVQKTDTFVVDIPVVENTKKSVDNKEENVQKSTKRSELLKAEKENVKENKTSIQKVDMTGIMAEHSKENNRIASIGGRLLNLNKQVKRAKGENLADQFLNSDLDTDSSAYAKTFKKKRPKEFDFKYPEPNESGFDLKEALNPHDNLDTIMSSFDFYQAKTDKK